MKQLLFLLLFPSLAMAQYPGNGNQKITLGEQTTADGLVFRGVASIDTVTATSKITRVNKQDTSAFILLDTVTNLLWHYKTGSNAWLQAGGSTFDTTTLNLTTRFAAKQNNITLTTTGTSGAATFSPVTATLNIPNYTITNPVTGTGTTNYLPKFTGTSIIGNSTIFDNGGNVLIGTTTDAGYKLNVNGTGRFAGSAVINGTSLDINPASGQPNITLRSGNTFRGYIEGNSSGGLSFGAGPAASIYFTLASTGAATFSSSVTATRLSLNNTGTAARIQVNGVNSEPIGYFYNNNGTAGSVPGVAIEAGTNTSDYSLSVASSLGTSRLYVRGDGNVGIGTASPAVQFHTTGAVRFATFAGGGTTTLDVDNTGNLARTSSIELKKDVTPINYGLNQILQINPINFNWIDEDKYGNENENGFIAEDVMNVIPNVVGSDIHGLFMDYTKLIPILTKAIQEQNLLIKALEQRILILENK